jgi:hypothetical protein
MSKKQAIGAGVTVLVLPFAAWAAWYAWSSISVPEAASDELSKNHPSASADPLEQRFSEQVRPFVERYCLRCHSGARPKGGLDLLHDTTSNKAALHSQKWELIQERLQAGEMPPESARDLPPAAERAAVVAWIKEMVDREAERSAGDPGPVLARRLSNAEFDYTIRDLTGVDIRPAREFPVDPANEAGFDNSGESLAMSPALAKKYLAAARLVADHVVLKPDGFVFAPHPAVTDTDRDKYCVQRIIDFYKRHEVDLADYFQAAWKYRERERLGQPDVTLNALAGEARLSARYLEMVWSALTEAEADAGPLAAVRFLWKELPQAGDQPAGARAGCEQMRDLVLRLRQQLKPEVKKLSANGISPGSQPLVLWNNRELASRHRSYSADIYADFQHLGDQIKDARPGLRQLLDAEPLGSSRERNRRALERFCSVFPLAFVVSDRGPYFDPKAAGKGRPLTAGFHLMQGFFRDDEPLCDLILSDAERRELDDLWTELDFITGAPLRQYRDFIFFERAEPPRFMFEAQFDFARSEDKDATSQAKMERLAKVYLEKARKKGARGDAEEAIVTYFREMSASIRRVEQARLAAETSHLEALVRFAERAYRRPLAAAEREEILAYYRDLRKKDDLGHEEALRDTLVSILMSPHFCFRFTLASPGTTAQSLGDYELASRLSYFLWLSMPDAELLDHAAAGDLHQRDVLLTQTRRMLRDPKVRGLATEFSGNWLDFRRFEEHNAVDRERFPSFTNELRQAMFEEPIRYFMDIGQHNRSVLDLLYGNDTFVNPVLARHYGMPTSASSWGWLAGGQGTWTHIEDADRYGRGGILPMAVFLTKNAPGLRTSPVKRGYWVVRRVLGEQIPPPPPSVPELPKDESKLGDLTLPQLLARHRSDTNCASCHRRFDSVGLVFEDFGPIGERRTKDLGGRPVETSATFPDGKDRTGLPGLRQYLKEKRQDDFVDNLCRKLFPYALSRSLMLSDKKALGEMRSRLSADGYAFGSLVEAIVTSPQFLSKRGRDDQRGQ